MEDAMGNTLLRVVNTISGWHRAENNLRNLREIEELYNLESDLADLQEEKKTCKAGQRC